jgi:hypothetical protein
MTEKDTDDEKQPEAEFVCAPRNRQLAFVPTPDLARRVDDTEARIEADLAASVEARKAGRNDEADAFCAKAEHRRGWVTSYRRELKSRARA